MELAGKPVRKDWQAYTNFLPEEARDAVRALFAGKERPTALIAPSDVTGVAIMRELREIGLSVPEDVSVVGYDDSVAARFAEPSLTSVNQPFFDMGARSAAQLAEMIDGNADGSQVTLPVNLVERGSVKNLG